MIYVVSSDSSHFPCGFFSCCWLWSLPNSWWNGRWDRLHHLSRTQGRTPKKWWGCFWNLSVRLVFCYCECVCGARKMQAHGKFVWLDRISKTYSEFRSLAHQLEKIKKAITKKKDSWDSLSASAKNIVKLTESINHLVDSQRTEYLGKVRIDLQEACFYIAFRRLF